MAEQGAISAQETAARLLQQLVGQQKLLRGPGRANGTAVENEYIALGRLCGVLQLLEDKLGLALLETKTLEDKVSWLTASCPSWTSLTG